MQTPRRSPEISPGAIRRCSCLLAFIALPACTTAPRAVVVPQAADTAPSPRVHVVSHGWHTGIIIGAETLNRHVPTLARRFPKAERYEVGWGDAGFYQASEITAAITLNAVFVPSDTVVHVVGFRGDPAANFRTSDVLCVSLTDKGMESLCEFIDSSFAKDRAGKPIRSGTGLYGDSQFYIGEGKYHLFNGCNKWTAKALRSGGVGIEPALKITSASVMDEFRTPEETSEMKRANRKGPR